MIYICSSYLAFIRFYTPILDFALMIEHERFWPVFL